ncbi:MAG: glycosyltransferase [Hyphomonadaceae bacterium]
MDLERASPQELRWRIAQLESELEQEVRLRQAIERSTFWRITAPFRLLLAPFTRLRRGLMGGARLGIPEPGFANRGRGNVKAQALPLQIGEAQFVFLTFKWHATARPCDVGSSTDSRALAASFRNLQLKNAGGKILAEVDFARGGNSLAHVCYGFSDIEDWGSWTQGRESTLLLWSGKDQASPLTLDVVAGVYQDAFASVSADVEVNGNLVGELMLDKAGHATLDIEATALAEAPWAGAAQNQSLTAEATPDISVIILNYNKPGITLAAVLALLRSKADATFEIIVLDNGSSSEAARHLADMKLPVRLIRLFANRFFGEGNNIAAEHARGRTLLFLNNDAFVGDNTLDLLLNALESRPTIGAVGPVFCYPDGTLQEVGAFLNKDGTAYQRGKRVPDFDLSALPPVEAVDYISAACVMLRREDFMALGGFDLRYDPAYYEDSDLCLRLLALGKETALVRDAVVRHIENATTSDPANKGLATDIVERHRQIFLSRWSDWLQARQPERLPKVEPLDVAMIERAIVVGKKAKAIHAVYSPFPLAHGGGERYLLGTGLALGQDLPTAFVTPDEYSGLRLNTLMRDLGYPTGKLFPEIERQILDRKVEQFVLMGNELLPTRAGYGSRRIYHCQFPFPANLERSAIEAGLRNLAHYERVVVNSEFTRTAYRLGLSELGVGDFPIDIIAPPVQMVAAGPNAPEKENIILMIGRFSPNGHAKRQDILVDAMRLAARTKALPGWRAVLCGMVPNDKASIAFYESILHDIEGLPIEVVLSPSRSQLEQWMLRAKIYVSATGTGVTAAKDFAKCEHFGITVVEAASAGCIPVVYELGGPADIVDHLGVGHRFSRITDLVTALEAAAESARDLKARQQAIHQAQSFSESAFMQSWRQLAGIKV